MKDNVPASHINKFYYSAIVILNHLKLWKTWPFICHSFYFIFKDVDINMKFSLIHLWAM